MRYASAVVAALCLSLPAAADTQDEPKTRQERADEAWLRIHFQREYCATNGWPYGCKAVSSWLLNWSGTTHSDEAKQILDAGTGLWTEAVSRRKSSGRDHVPDLRDICRDGSLGPERRPAKHCESNGHGDVIGTADVGP